MSSENETPTEDFSASAIWPPFSKRLTERLPKKKIQEFGVQVGLDGFRLDRVAQGKKGVDVLTLVKICRKLDLSPAWLLFGIGTEQLSVLADPEVERVLRYMETCGEARRRAIADELTGQRKQKTAASGQERKKESMPASYKKAKGPR